MTDLGSLPGDERVTFARNNKAPIPDILCVTENDVYKIHRDAPPETLAEPDLPQPLAVMFIDGYFVFLGVIIDALEEEIPSRVHKTGSKVDHRHLRARDRGDFTYL